MAHIHAAIQDVNSIVNDNLPFKMYKTFYCKVYKVYTVGNNFYFACLIIIVAVKTYITDVVTPASLLRSAKGDNKNAKINRNRKLYLYRYLYRKYC